MLEVTELAKTSSPLTWKEQSDIIKKFLNIIKLTQESRSFLTRITNQDALQYYQSSDRLAHFDDDFSSHHRADCFLRGYLQNH